MDKVGANGNQTKTETYEDNAKTKFREEPANMKLLIVVSKLLTGAAEDMIVPVPTFTCSKCSHVNEQFQVKDSKPQSTDKSKIIS